jgi:glucose 1-dehydrogenase
LGNQFKKLAYNTERCDPVIDAFLALAHAIITLRRLIRQAWTLYRWDTRPARRPDHTTSLARCWPTTVGGHRVKPSRTVQRHSSRVLARRPGDRGWTGWNRPPAPWLAHARGQAKTGGHMRRPVTIVTGGSRGIGAATCARLATDGHDLVIGYRSAAEAAEKIAGTIRDTGSRCVAVQLDTRVEADVERLFDTAAELGPVTGLVNNAGVTGRLGRLVDARAEDLRSVVEVNVIGYLFCARRAARDMARNGGGAIVNVSSAAATIGSPGEYVHYAGAKAAVDAITVGLAKELASDGIRVNAVAPGIVWTDIHRDMGDPERPAKAASRIPLGRAGDPEEIAAAVAWLLSPDASYTTGAVLRVAGGL